MNLWSGVECSAWPVSAKLSWQSKLAGNTPATARVVFVCGNCDSAAGAAVELQKCFMKGS